MDFFVRSNARIALLVVAVACLVGFAIAALSQSLPTHAVSTVSFFAFVTLLVCALPIGRRLAAGTFDLFEPIVFACAMLAMLCGIRPIITVATGDYILDHRYDASRFFDDAVLVGLAGTAAFVICYELVALSYSGRRKPSRRRIGVDPQAALQYGILISGMALALYALYVKRAGGIGSLLAQRSTELVNQLGNTSEYLSAAPVAIACAAILLVIAYRGNLSLGNRATVIALAMTPALLFAMLGNRRFIVPCLLLPLVVGYLTSGKRPRTSRVLIIVPVAFMILATIPFARTEGARKQAGGLAPIYQRSFQQPGKTIARFANGPDTDMMLYLSVQMAYQKSSGRYYRGSASVGDFLIAPIPSAAFKNKPQTARNDIIERLFGAPCTNVGGGLCPDFSVMGTFYQDFWWPGAIIGMALMGLFSSWLWRRFKLKPESPYLALLTAVTTIYLPIIIRAGLLPAATWVFYFVIPTAVGIRIARVETVSHSHRLSVDEQPHVAAPEPDPPRPTALPA